MGERFDNADESGAERDESQFAVPGTDASGEHSPEGPPIEIEPGDDPSVDDTHSLGEDHATDPESAVRLPRLSGARRGARRKGRRLVKKPESDPTPVVTPEQRLLLLDTWKRSGLPAKEFADLVGVAKYTLYTWKKKFEEYGPAGLMDKPRGGPRGSRLSEVTKRAILMLKEEHPAWAMRLHLYDSTQQLIISNFGSGNNGQPLISQALTAGSYFAMLEHRFGNDVIPSYTLTVR